MLIVSDHDVLGAAAVLGRVLDSEDWAEYASEFGICFSDFAALGLQADAPDRLVWETCQAAGAVLLTGNRAGGSGSLDETIRELSGEASLPVVTLGDPTRVIFDRVYAQRCAERLLNVADTLEGLLGTGRLFIP